MILSQIETRKGEYEIHKLDDGSYRILLKGNDMHGYCTADDVIAWMSNALHNAEYLLTKQK